VNRVTSESMSFGAMDWQSQIPFVMEATLIARECSIVTAGLRVLPAGDYGLRRRS